MNKQEYLLTQLSSECNEVAHRVSKILHFGLEEIQKSKEQNPKNLTNKQRLKEELIDLFAVLIILNEKEVGKVVDFDFDSILAEDDTNFAIGEKINKVAKYMKYALKMGTLK